MAIFIPIHLRLAAARAVTDRSAWLGMELNKRGSMTARHKLNSAAILGALFWAAIAGIASKSLLVFLLLFALLIALSIHNRSIRL